MTGTADFMSCLFVHVCVEGKPANLKISVWEWVFFFFYFLAAYVMSVSEHCHVWDHLLSAVKRGTWAAFKMRHTGAISGLLQMWFMLNRASVAEVWPSAEENGIFLVCFWFFWRGGDEPVADASYSQTDPSSAHTWLEWSFFFLSLLVSDCLPPLCLFSYAE